jgi:predicted esterase
VNYPTPTAPREPLAGFTYQFVAAGAGGDDPGYVLLLLHGTGGDESDLLPLGAMLAPGAALVSPRGRVVEAGMPRFFRRVREGVFDVEDLKARAGELAAFVAAARIEHHLETRPWIAVGFSNGVNIAGGLLLEHPSTLQGAVLLRPMVPFTPASPPSLAGIPVLIAAGDQDPCGKPEQIARLRELLEWGKARVTLHRNAVGHNLTMDDVDAARDWLHREIGKTKR